jgi:tetratricopeptide (TPR) repeat protein
MDFAKIIIAILGIQDVIIEDIKRFKKDLRIEIKVRQHRRTREVAEQLILVDGDTWIRKMFESRNRQDWKEVLRIYNGPLSGPWQSVAEAKLQAALALNRRNHEGDRELAFRYTAEVIANSQGKAILSEAYGIRARVFKDMHRFDEAIATYKQGFNSNPMDYYPGIAAIMLMVQKGTPEAQLEAVQYGARADGSQNSAAKAARKSTTSRFLVARNVFAVGNVESRMDASGGTYPRGIGEFRRCAEFKLSLSGFKANLARLAGHS